VRIKVTPDLVDGLIRYEWERGDGDRAISNSELDAVERALDRAEARRDECRQRFEKFRNSLDAYGESGRQHCGSSALTGTERATKPTKFRNDVGLGSLSRILQSDFAMIGAPLSG
jgi:hypothetical protein